jgi:hypothetical protein
VVSVADGPVVSAGALMVTVVAAEQAANIRHIATISRIEYAFGGWLLFIVPKTRRIGRRFGRTP